MNYQDLKLTNTTNVYLDISIDDIKCGRVVIELFTEHVPRTAENFRALCTGERGNGGLQVPLHYKNSIFFKAVPECIVQGGDITNNDGTGGESIYGPYFKDDKLDILHSDKGLLSMANCGMPHTNNSQFCVTLGEAPHLDGRHCVFGRILKGFNVINEISYQPLDPQSRPIPCCKIWDCGELAAGQEWGYCDNDFSDIYPPYPEDWEPPTTSPLQIDEAIRVVNHIKDAGNDYYQNGDMEYALRKYKKALKYIHGPIFHSVLSKDPDLLTRAIAQCRLNSALACTRLRRHREAIYHCNQVPGVETNPKALFRRALAHEGLNDHQDATRDLEHARRLAPNDRVIAAELDRIRSFLDRYEENERLRYARMFRA